MGKPYGFIIILLLSFLIISGTAAANELLLKHPPFIVNDYINGDFRLAFNQEAADLYVAESDQPGVARALNDLSEDIKSVTGLKPIVKTSEKELGTEAVIVGTIGHSPVIDQLIASGKLDVEEVSDQWEAYVIQVVPEPLPNVDYGLVIAGSDRRGTIYGIYEISRQIGVSPWYWWADVEPEKQDELIVQNGIYKQGEPSVKYRGIFLNNEAPSLSTWVGRFGGFNHQFYENIFELVLRLRGNFLWPAMWSPKSFFRDDHLNPELAHEYGVVIGTSHHEPMMRAWGEWARYGSGEWNYSTNKEKLLEFWEGGIEWAKDYEKIVTVGMRGDGDEPMMHDGTVEEMVDIMENIITDQRNILAERINSDVTQIPQAWALYKEVQELYESGLDVPEDVTILLGNDNFGNIRMLPQGEERDHPGGFGMYYHFDYVGGPKSYRWVNSTPNQKIWEQMSMTYDYGVDQIWIVNVGDLKPHEIAIEFFLEMAYDIARWNKDNLDEFTLQWAEREFGSQYAAEIAHITDTYRKFTGRKKSEDINPGTYSLLNYKEAERVLAEFEEITAQAEEIYDRLPEEKKDAFFQLVLYPTRASKNVLKVNVYAGLNTLYAQQGRTIANLYADLAEQVFEDEAADTAYYNNELANGKWRGIMSNAHIGQTGWETPEKNIMPTVRRVPITSGSEMGITIEGKQNVITSNDILIRNLPSFSVLRPERHYFDIFNLKTDPFAISVTPNQAWIKIYQENENVELQTRVWVEIDWEQAPQGNRVRGDIDVTGAGKTITLPVIAYNPDLTQFSDLAPMTFIESDGYISIEAEHYTNNVMVDGLKWEKIDNYGRTLSSMAVFPTVSDFRSPDDAPYLEYEVYINIPGDATVTVYTAPTNNINRTRGLHYGIAFDDQPFQIVDTFPKENDAYHTSPLWSRGVMENVRTTTTRHNLDAGLHTLRFSMVDPGVVLQKIVINTGGVNPSYLGPPESYYVGKTDRVDNDGYLQLLATVDYGKQLLAKTKVGSQHGNTTHENLDVFKNELRMVRLVLADEDATLPQRQEALERLKESIKTFKSKLVHKEGYEELAVLVADCNEFVLSTRIGDKHGEYPAEARMDFQKAIRSASAVLRNDDAADSERQEMLALLSKARETFEKSVVHNPDHRALMPVSDTFVRGGGYSKENHGDSPNLEVKWEKDNDDMTRVAFLKFDISDFKTIESAVLRLYVEFSDQLENRIIALYDVSEAELLENEATWENTPITGGAFITENEVSSQDNLWYEYDVTKALQDQVEQGVEQFIVRVENQTSHWGGLIRITSKEGGENTPELNVIGLTK